MELIYTGQVLYLIEHKNINWAIRLQDKLITMPFYFIRMPKSVINLSQKVFLIKWSNHLLGCQFN